MAGFCFLNADTFDTDTALYLPPFLSPPPPFFLIGSGSKLRTDDQWLEAALRQNLTHRTTPALLAQQTDYAGAAPQTSPAPPAHVQRQAASTLSIPELEQLLVSWGRRSAVLTQLNLAALSYPLPSQNLRRRPQDQPFDQRAMDPVELRKKLCPWKNCSCGVACACLSQCKWYVFTAGVCLLGGPRVSSRRTTTPITLTYSGDQPRSDEDWEEILRLVYSGEPTI